MDFVFLILIASFMVFLLREVKVETCEIARFTEGRCVLIYATSFWQKKIGLLNHLKLDRNCGIFFKNVKSIHTTGMTFEFDVIFVDKFYRVTAVVPNVKTGQKSISGPTGSRHVIELGQGTILAESFKVGDDLTFIRGTSALNNGRKFG